MAHSTLYWSLKTVILSRRVTIQKYINIISVFLDFLPLLIFQTEHSISATGSISILRWKGEEAHTYLFTWRRKWSMFWNAVFRSEYQMMNKVQKPTNPECDIPSSYPFTTGYYYNNNNISGTHFYNTYKNILQIIHYTFKRKIWLVSMVTRAKILTIPIMKHHNMLMRTTDVYKQMETDRYSFFVMK